MLCQNCGQPVEIEMTVTYDRASAEDFTTAANAEEVFQRFSGNVNYVTAELFCLCGDTKVSDENQDKLLAFFDEIA